MAFGPAIVASVLVMFCWGISDILIALCTRKRGLPFTFIISQTLIIAFYVPVAFVVGNFPSLSFTSVMLLLVMGIIGLAGALMFFKGMQEGVVSVVSPIIGCVPIVTVGITIFYLGEKVSGLNVVGILLAALGAILSSVKLSKMGSLGFASIEKGALYGFSALLLLGIYWALADLLTQSMGWFYPIFLSKAIGLMLLGAYLSVKPMGNWSLEGKRQKLIWLVMVIGLLEFFGHLLYGYGISIEQSAIVAPIVFAYPALTILIAYFAFKERLEKTQYAGIAVALLGIVMIVA